MRPISHELVLQLQQGSSHVVDAKLVPGTLPILDILEEAASRQKQLAFIVSVFQVLSSFPLKQWLFHVSNNCNHRLVSSKAEQN